MDFEVIFDINAANNCVVAFPISRVAVPIPSSDQSKKNWVATYFVLKVGDLADQKSQNQNRDYNPKLLGVKRGGEQLTHALVLLPLCPNVCPRVGLNLQGLQVRGELAANGQSVVVATARCGGGATIPLHLGFPWKRKRSMSRSICNGVSGP